MFEMAKDQVCSLIAVPKGDPLWQHYENKMFAASKILKSCFPLNFKMSVGSAYGC